VSIPYWLRISPEVQAALSSNRPVVALESTLITHGLPWPTNLETAKKAESAVRQMGAIPATIAVLEGQPTVGLSDEQLVQIAQTQHLMKASRRDLATAVALKRSAGTTVSATMALAYQAGIRVFATGGIGGAHKQPDSKHPFDISADLTELSRTPVLVVCTGAKSILDLPQTVELLETFGVPVIGYKTDEIPTFYVKGGEGTVSTRVDSIDDAAKVFHTHVILGGRGAVLVHPLDEDVAVPPELFNQAMLQAEEEALARGVRGADVTPFLLARLADLTVGKTLVANQALIVGNAKLAAEIATALIKQVD
jgi:pseudouridylate synthase